MRTIAGRGSAGAWVRAGLSFVEATLCVVILSSLVLMAVPLSENGERRALELEARRALRELRSALDRFHELELRKAPGLDDRRAWPAGLSALVEGRLIRRIPVDPLTGKDDWVTVSTTDEPPGRRPVRSDFRDVFDVRTRATGTTLDGVDYGDL